MDAAQLRDTQRRGWLEKKRMSETVLWYYQCKRHGLNSMLAPRSHYVFGTYYPQAKHYLRISFIEA